MPIVHEPSINGICNICFQTKRVRFVKCPHGVCPTRVICADCLTVTKFDTPEHHAECKSMQEWFRGSSDSTRGGVEGNEKRSVGNQTVSLDEP